MILMLACNHTNFDPHPYAVVKERSHLRYNAAPESQLRQLVEMSGLEPLTPCVQSRCSPS